MGTNIAASIGEAESVHVDDMHWRAWHARVLMVWSSIYDTLIRVLY